MTTVNDNMIAGRYEVFKHIGKGGMADVFLATDTILNRQVAIKILRAELSTDTTSVIRFEREAMAATALSHPNIVEIYDVGEYKGHHYIVMEYVPGVTLKKLIQQRGGLIKEEAVDIMKQLVSAISEAHRRGIIHRDIKPQNIIVKSDGSIKVLDFGIALAKGSMQLTQANNVMGSVHYLAPELARGKPATPQSDIYALGIVLYEMLTGDVPFKAETAVQVALMQMRDPIKDARSINASIPQSLDNIIIRATAKDPNQRYRSCDEMLADLKTCLNPERRNEPRLYMTPTKIEKDLRTEQKMETHSQAVQKSTRSEEKKSVKTLEKRKNRKNKSLLILLVVLLVMLLAGGTYLALSSTEFFNPAAKLTVVPELNGMTLGQARNACIDNNLVLDESNVQYALTSDVEKGQIYEVSPSPGTEVEKGSRITVSVSSGIGIAVKNYVGMKITDAQKDLSQYKLMKVDVVEEENDGVVPGTVIRQELLTPGTQFDQTAVSEIRLVYASYPTVTIPDDIVGKTIEEARVELEAMGITVYSSNMDISSLTDEEKAALTYGVVIDSSPKPGEQYTQRDDNYVTLYYY